MAIDRTSAIAELAKIEPTANEEGLIPAFGLLIQQLPASFWNNFSDKIIQAAGEDLYESAAGLLENAGSECGYHTGWGIINSYEFKAIIGPMINPESAKEDLLEGAFAVVTAFGWANIAITELIPGEKMILKATDYYEADIKKNAPSLKQPFALMLKGISRAFMDIAYGDAEYPNGLGKFKCEQTKAIELGDPYGEFIVTRA